jgi:adenylate cyclase
MKVINMSKEQKVTRKLRAILSADVKGYSLLIADNEVHTIETLKKYRQIMSDQIRQHTGRVVDSPGDNLMAEFSSAVDAVQCAVEIQNRLKKENARYVEDKRLQFRIGVNIGDVIQDGDRIYGTGVNVAARIEGLADPGGVCISRNAYDHVKNRLDYGFEYLGEHDVKNIKEPVRIYKVLSDIEVLKPLVEEKLELPDKPSIAVLPFDNMSGDPRQEYFSDGLTEQIINGLCKVSNLFVIARNTSFAYKGKGISIKQIAHELGVRYILEGSVQRAQDRVRITAQLIDSTTDYHVWSENYDRDLTDIFALQDEIALSIMYAMQIKLTYGEQARLWEGDTKNIQAFDKQMRGFECFYNLNEKDNNQARHFFNEAINIDNTSAMPYAMLGFTHIIDLWYGYTKSPLQSFEEVEKNVAKALTLNDSLDLAHLLLGWIYLLKRKHEKAIIECERAVALNPNGAEVHAHLALMHIYSDETELAIKLIKRAIRLNPIPPPHYYDFLAMAHSNNGQYEEAIELCKKGLRGYPDELGIYLTLSACYSALNRMEEAHNTVAEILRINPNFNLEYYSKTLPYKNQETLDKYIEALRKAGLP